MKKNIQLGSNFLQLNTTTRVGEPVVWLRTEHDDLLLTKEQVEQAYEFFKSFLGTQLIDEYAVPFHSEDEEVGSPPNDTFTDI